MHNKHATSFAEFWSKTSFEYLISVIYVEVFDLLIEFPFDTLECPILLTLLDPVPESSESPSISNYIFVLFLSVVLSVIVSVFFVVSLNRAYIIIVVVVVVVVIAVVVVLVHYYCSVSLLLLLLYWFTIVLLLSLFLLYWSIIIVWYYYYY